MNQADQDTFNSIVALSPEALTDAQIDFLYARRSYLNREQRNAFGNVIKVKDAQVAEAAENPEGTQSTKDNTEK